MLEYSIENTRYLDTGEVVPFSESQIGANPFPGLRPFTLNESHLFFGREGQVDEIMLKLAQNRSVTVMGYSGSGKSSLLFCGLIPVLLGGFMTEYGPNWRVATVRPGISPINNLAQSLVDSMIQSGKIDYTDRKIHQSFLASVLRRGKDGLAEAVKFIQSKNENFFLLVDQFEEIFRYRDIDNPDIKEEATAYVHLIQHAIKQQDVPIFVIISMRSDFIGQCAAFPGLTAVINKSNYLVPRMTRDQKRLAIAGPVAVGGGQIAPRLLKRILADVSESQDQLTVMQHALMRTWDYWVENHEENEPIDIRHYNSVGKIRQALSLHANEAYDELSPRQKEIAEVMFKSLTERTQDNLEMRRPAKISLIARLAGSSEAEVIKVAETFRKPGRSFLMPAASVALHADTVLELSHESLMRIWTRLSTWVFEEFESALMYRRVSEAAAMYQVGKTNLWRPPDLQLALNWQKKQRPTRLWAQRYDDAFERAIVFLDTSRITYEAELKNQEMLQRRILRRARVTNIILAVFLMIAIGFFFFGYTQQLKAEAKAKEAQIEKQNALDAQKIAEEQRGIANDRLKQVQAQAKLLEDRRRELERNNARLAVALQDAEAQKRRAEEALILAEQQTDLANKAATEARKQSERADENYQKANALLMLSVAQSMEAKSVSIEDPELAGLTALQGYTFHNLFGGNKYDPYVFGGLYTALTKSKGVNYNAIEVPDSYRSHMLGLAVSKKTDEFYITGTDGRIVKGNLSYRTAEEIISENEGHPNRVLALSDNDRYLVNSSDSSYLEIFNLATYELPTRINVHSGLVTDIEFLPNSLAFISSSVDGTLMITDPITGLSDLLIQLPYDIKSFDINKDGTQIILGSAMGNVALIDMKDYSIVELFNEAPNRILSVAFHPSKPLIAYGIEVVNELYMPVKGTVKVYDLNSAKQKELSGHTAGIADLVFSHNGELLASAGLDGKLQMWIVDHEEDLPVIMNSANGFVWKADFTNDDQHLVASCNNGNVLVWPTDASALADQICETLGRNMTREEWSVYVGRDISYEVTCKGLPIPESNN